MNGLLGSLREDDLSFFAEHTFAEAAQTRGPASCRHQTLAAEFRREDLWPSRVPLTSGGFCQN